MSQEAEPTDAARKTVVYQIPGMDAVAVRRDVEYQGADGGALTLDVYYPPDATLGARLPAVVIVAGFPDPGFQRMMGCKFKDMGSSVSWGRLAAASGIVAVTYTNLEPERDLHALLEHLRQNAASLGIAEHRIAVWASSGNVPLALSILMREPRSAFKCAVFCYGFSLDLDGSTLVAEAARQWGFANPGAGRSVADLPVDLPLFVARAGRDEIPHLNEALDLFLAAAVSCNLPISFVNHPTAPHAFDLMDDSATSREIIASILAFMRFHLTA
jgi:hypothetical protein